MSKLSADSLRETISAVLEGSKEKPRKFTETIELQISVCPWKYRGTHTRGMREEERDGTGLCACASVCENCLKRERKRLTTTTNAVYV